MRLLFVYFNPRSFSVMWGQRHKFRLQKPNPRPPPPNPSKYNCSLALDINKQKSLRPQVVNRLSLVRCFGRTYICCLVTFVFALLRLIRVDRLCLLLSICRHVFRGCCVSVPGSVDVGRFRLGGSGSSSI